MDVDLRPVRKLRESAAARAALGPIIEAICASPADLSRLRLVCDWIQYKQNFREPVVSRPVGTTDTEIAVDLRRSTGIDLEADGPTDETRRGHRVGLVSAALPASAGKP